MIKPGSLEATSLVLALALAACSSQDAPPDAAEATESAVSPSAPAAEPSVPEASAAPGPARDSADVLRLEGLDDLRIGKAVPEGSTWAERGAQTGDACRVVSSPDHPGVYAITANGIVRRITVGKRSTVKLVEGIGVGASETDVRKWFAGFREEPHKYEAPPAKYLTAPNAARSDSALRFEIGQDGKVALIHVGTMPELGLVEGCA
ncbi:hypothetical protein HNO88_000427 [Novosphingobium chloroacetimidivorans]|uniref:Lipoprotein n=1 Tax=Novosphingobium chloroacetimidivorans TaxID=1428314 RepID=A0A7W7K726_9SPHN|nr:hypothetical protein [Novosphingobium chloroacetimidivorans]MBB4857130.1 hypothetical protein [Novosphingobium chloroacetimidivorans]